MKKHLFLLLFAIVASIGTMVASVTIDGIKYNLNETKQTAEVTHGYQETYSGNIVIPSQVTYSGKTYHVTSIGEKAFGDCEGLTSIDIPNSVTSIGDRAFAGCEGLTSVTIPNGVLSIGQYAFYWCTSLKSVVVGINVRSVGMWAFEYCESLTTVTMNSHPMVSSSSNTHRLSEIFGEQVPQYVLGDAITSIKDGVFSGCSGMKSITISKSVINIEKNAFNGCSGITSVVWNAKNCGTYNFGSQVESFTFGDEVEVIPQQLCQNMTKLTSITIPNSVKRIGGSAFDGCSGLTAVHISDIAAWCAIVFDDDNSNPLASAKHLYLNGTEVADLVIPDGITSIGDYVFKGCSGLTSVTIPKSVTSIGYNAFYGCGRLTAVHISDIAAWCAIVFGGYYSNPLSFAKHLYLNGTEITDLVIPDGVTSIGKYAFYGGSSLTSVSIPNSITSIGERAFNGCKSLTTVHISDIAAWCAIVFDGPVSNPLSHAKHLYLNGTEITDLVIPDGVTSIGKRAFEGCLSLTSVTIPNSVTSIGDMAFYNCSSLTSVTIPNSVTSIGEGAFINCSSLTSVTIGNSVTSIGMEAFASCNGLTSITCKAVNPPDLGRSVFNEVDKSIPLYVPAASIAAYKAADQWKEFNIQAIDNSAVEDIEGARARDSKVLRDGQLFILRGDKTYTVQGQQVK